MFFTVSKEDNFFPNQLRQNVWVAFKRKKISFFIGNKVDASEIQLLFQDLGFTVREHRNLTVSKIHEVFKEQASANHSPYFAFGACILTRKGDTENNFWGTDGTVDLKDVVDIIHNSPSLRSKPKLFILHFAAGNFIFKVCMYYFLGVDNFSLIQVSKCNYEEQCN